MAHAVLAQVCLDAALVDAPSQDEGWSRSTGSSTGRVRNMGGSRHAIGMGGCALVLLVNCSLVQRVAAAGQKILRALAFACEGRVRLSVVFGLSVVVAPNTHRTRP